MSSSSRTRIWLATGAAALTLVTMATGCTGVKTAPGGGGGDDEDAFPSDNIELVVSATPGGGTDLIGRALAQGLSEHFDVAVPVLNTPGANGAVAAGDVLNGAATGYRIVILPASLMTITPMFVDESEVIDVEDMSIITGIGREDYVLLANADSEFRTLADVADASRTLNYATTGVGSGSQLTQRLIFDALAVPSVDIPFEGGASAITGLLGNQVDFLSTQLLEAMPHITSGALVPIAIFGQERNEFLPDVPTASESGYDVVVTQSRFMAAPKGTPDAVLDTLRAGFAEAFTRPEYIDLIKSNYITPEETDGEATANALRAAREQYADAVAAAGLDLAAG